VLAHHQRADAPQQHGVHVDQASGDDAAGLGGQELLPGRDCGCAAAEEKRRAGLGQLQRWCAAEAGAERFRVLTSGMISGFLTGQGIVSLAGYPAPAQHAGAMLGR
jgi:hypothetical protein